MTNDEVGEDSKAANDQIGHSDERDAAPYKRISEGFLGLVHLVHLVLDAGLVMTNALNKEALLIFRVAFRRHGTVREKVANHERPCTCKETENEKKQLPVLDGSTCEVRNTKGK